MNTDNEKLIETLIRDSVRMGIGWPKADYLDGWVADRVKEFADALEAAEKAHTPSTPTDDEREAIIDALLDELGWEWDEVPEEHIPSSREILGDMADRVLAVSAGFRRTSVPEPSAEEQEALVSRMYEATASIPALPEPTNEQVKTANAAWGAYWDDGSQESYGEEGAMRAALRAASAAVADWIDPATLPENREEPNR